MPKRRLSPLRLLIALSAIGIISYSSITSAVEWLEARATSTTEPWFASYVDVTATPVFGFEELASDPTNDVILSFIVASSSDNCSPSWGTHYSLEQASQALDLDRRIARLKQREGSFSVSFGGLINNELAVACTDERKLMQAYMQVIDRYELDTIDIDLEGAGLTDTEAAARRAQVIAQIQQEQRQKGKNLAVWLTLPVLPQGLTEDGTSMVSTFLDANVDIAGVNIMTMNFGQALSEGMTMADGSIEALKSTHRQLGILYDQSGIALTSATLWTKLGATPMLGQNDVMDEIFTLDDAKKLNTFAHSQGIGRMSMWSANRDVACGDNYVNLSIVSDSCSGQEQEIRDYARILSANFDGNSTLSSGGITISEPEATVEVVDDPKTSPYQIWDEQGTYLEGTKVVWKRHVYEAKWWTQGDLPDNPVLDSWQTPWKLIGPVLAGETPIKQAKLPEGTYVNWDGEVVYNESNRVLFEGIPYQAKWWNKGQSPAAASSSPDTSPWVPLTQAQINELLQTITQ